MFNQWSIYVRNQSILQLLHVKLQQNNTCNLFHHTDGWIARFGGNYYLESGVYDNDEISLEMNCKELTLKYFRNGEDCGFAFNRKRLQLIFEHDGKDCKYCFAVALHGATVAFIDFEHRLTTD